MEGATPLARSVGSELDGVTDFLRTCSTCLMDKQFATGRWSLRRPESSTGPWVLAYGRPCQGLPPSNTYGRRTCRSRPILTSIRRRFTGPGADCIRPRCYRISPGVQLPCGPALPVASVCGRESRLYYRECRRLHSFNSIYLSVRIRLESPISRVASANPLTAWDSHVKLTTASVQTATGLRQCVSEPNSLFQVRALTQRSICYVDFEDHSKPG